jgi:hypothetical protein
MSLQDLKSRVHRRLLERLNLSNLESVSKDQASEAIRQAVQDLLAAEGAAINLEERDRLVREVLDEIFGLGPLEPLMQDPDVSDVLVNTFDENGYAENGDIRLQLKASDSFRYSKDGSEILFSVGAKHYSLWINEPMPVFLVLYDAGLRKAYWLYVQEYFSDRTARRPKRGARSLTLHVPVKNRFTPRTVDYMRAQKAAILRQIEGQVQHGS